MGHQLAQETSNDYYSQEQGNGQIATTLDPFFYFELNSMNDYIAQTWSRLRMKPLLKSIFSLLCSSIW